MNFKRCPRCAADVEIKHVQGGFHLFGKCPTCGLEYKTKEMKSRIHLE